MIRGRLLVGYRPSFVLSAGANIVYWGMSRDPWDFKSRLRHCHVRPCNSDASFVRPVRGSAAFDGAPCRIEHASHVTGRDAADPVAPALRQRGRDGVQRRPTLEYPAAYPLIVPISLE